MNARSRLTRVLVACTAVLVLGAAPVAATESAPADGEGDGRITIPESSRDRAGLIFFGIAGLAGAAALANAAKQLKGERPQADGKIRWR